MPPAPARIASTPRQNSRTSWNPAVPPPPVAGGAAGNELADGLGDDGLGLRVVALGVALLGVAARGEALLGVGVLGVGVLGVGVLGVGVLGVLLEVAALDVPVAGAVGAARPVPPGESEGGVVDGEPPVQADTDAVRSTAKAAQLRTVPRKRHRP
jgi:hypothetical protein